MIYSCENILGIGCLLLHLVWQGGLARIKSNLQSRVKKGAMSAEAAEKALSLVSGELTYDNFKKVGVTDILSQLF
jgi:3-hydroxyacyl-CoA dehydrogenase